MRLCFVVVDHRHRCARYRSSPLAFFPCVNTQAQAHACWYCSSSVVSKEQTPSVPSPILHRLHLQSFLFIQESTRSLKSSVSICQNICLIYRRLFYCPYSMPLTTLCVHSSLIPPSQFPLPLPDWMFSFPSAVCVCLSVYPSLILCRKSGEKRGKEKIEGNETLN